MEKCNYCSEEIEKGYFICSDCNSLRINEEINRCRCGNYKDSSYERCNECHEKFRDGKINDKMIKGRIAEAIIEEMFLAMNYEVFRFGMENTVPGFSHRDFPKQGEVATQVRNMPDFIIVKDNKISFIEVKYRNSGEFDYKGTYEDNYPYPNAYIILVSPNHIKIQKASELSKGKEFIFLNHCPDFETDKAIILEYIDFCKKFFGN